ncbi:MAG: hypothetical protein ACXVAX_01585 [Pseudobdellovibrio sp.]
MITSRRSAHLLLFLTGASNLIYELCLAQISSSFFGGTLYYYTLNIGIFILFMGIGSLIADKVEELHLTRFIILTELILFLIATTMPFYVVFSEKFLSHGLFHLLLWTTNMALGLLSGFELPLFNRIFKIHSSTGDILFFDYIGMFCGSLAFSFLILPRLGVFSTLWVAAFINGLVLIYFLVRRRFGSIWITGSMLLPAACVTLLGYGSSLLDFLRQYYVS